MPTFDHGRERGRRDVRPRPPLVAGAPDEAVVGADPDVAVGHARRRDRVDDAAARPRARGGDGGRGIEGGGHAGVLARQVGADRAPVPAAVLGAEELLVGEVEDARVAAGEHERQRPGAAVLARLGEGGVDRLGLHRAQVEPLDACRRRRRRGSRGSGTMLWLSPPAVISRNCVRLMPSIPVGAAGHGRGARVLLRAVDPVREPVVGGHAVDLRGRLVVPGAPGPAAVEGHDARPGRCRGSGGRGPAGSIHSSW